MIKKILIIALTLSLFSTFSKSDTVKIPLDLMGKVHIQAKKAEICTGSLVGPKVILTSAFCLLNPGGKTRFVSADSIVFEHLNKRYNIEGFVVGDFDGFSSLVVGRDYSEYYSLGTAYLFVKGSIPSKKGYFDQEFSRYLPRKIGYKTGKEVYISGYNTRRNRFDDDKISDYYYVNLGLHNQIFFYTHMKRPSMGSPLYRKEGDKYIIFAIKGFAYNDSWESVYPMNDETYTDSATLLDQKVLHSIIHTQTVTE